MSKQLSYEVVDVTNPEQVCLMIAPCAMSAARNFAFCNLDDDGEPQIWDLVVKQTCGDKKAWSFKVEKQMIFNFHCEEIDYE